MTRHDRIAGAQGQVYDLLVVGGGITGAGVAREAAWSGLSTLLVEKNDYAAGTSSRSSKLLHGGLRYLENYEFHLVFEAVRERMEGYRLAPHLVEPIPFLFPQYVHDRPGINILSLGLWLYDAMAGLQTFGLHKRLSAAQFAEVAPGIRTEGLRGGFRYWDARTDDARLTLEIILDAQQLGATTLNRMSVEKAQRDAEGLWNCELADELTGERLTVRARSVVIAAGAWLDAVAPIFEGGEPRKRMRPTKGVHLLVPRSRLPIRETMVVMHPRDKRVSFAIPIDDHVVIGTSDTDHPQLSLEPGVSADDVTYMLEGVNHLFPDAHLTAADVYTSYAGLRPLVFEGEKAESQVSREHDVFTVAESVFAIAGGKLTTWRIMASDVLRPLMKARKAKGFKPERKLRALYRRVLPGVGTYKSRAEILSSTDNIARQHNLPAEAVRTLLQAYGARTQAVIEFAKTRPDGFQTLGKGQLIAGVFDFAVAHEDALTLDDLMRRRTPLFYNEPDQGRAAAAVVARRVAPMLGWDDTRVQQEVAAYQTMCDLYRPQVS